MLQAPSKSPPNQTPSSQESRHNPVQEWAADHIPAEEAAAAEHIPPVPDYKMLRYSLELVDCNLEQVAPEEQPPLQSPRVPCWRQRGHLDLVRFDPQSRSEPGSSGLDSDCIPRFQE